MRIPMTVSVAGALLGIAVIPPQHVPSAIYLFDCEGTVQRLDRASASLTRAVPVHELDATLPEEVRDGCAVDAGWYDTTAERLMLVAQTQMWQQDDSVPTKVLSLSVPSLAVVGARGGASRPAEPRHLEVPDLRSIQSPFDRSVAYVLNDRTTVLLQELATSGGHAGLSMEPDLLWHAGEVSLRSAHADATGRYAVYDLATGKSRGQVVKAPPGASENRVVCFTPRGTILIATARDTLLVLDTVHPAHYSRIGDKALDLYWTACAWQ